jgi:hypothetical protein
VEKQPKAGEALATRRHRAVVVDEQHRSCTRLAVQRTTVKGMGFRKINFRLGQKNTTDNGGARSK